IYRIVPAGVALPRGVEELQALVRWAADTRTPLVPRGSGSGMPGGAVGRGVVVDLSSGFHWLAPDWAHRALWSGASATAAQIGDAARPFGLRLAPDPPSAAFAPSGGLTATNAAGPRSVRCGSVRAWVDAVEIVEADGTARRVTRGEGKGERFVLSPDQRKLVPARFPHTRKNSSGYALDRYVESGDELDLLIGAEGTLALVTAVRWRLEPIPPDVAGAALGFASLEALGHAVPFLIALNPSAVELLDRTFLELVGGCGPLERLAAYIAGVRTAPGRCGVPVALFGHAGDGHVHVNALPDTTIPAWREALAGLFAAVTELLVTLGGTPSGEHGDGRLRAGLLERFYGPEVMSLFRDVKRAYDPGLILNPGVILPSPEWAPLVDLKVGADVAPIPDDIAARLREIERPASWPTPKLDRA